MGLFDWIRKPKDQPPAFSEADKKPTSIREFGLSLQLPFRWEKVEDPELPPETVCYRCPPIPCDAVFITVRRFVKPTAPEELAGLLRAIAESYVKSTNTQNGVTPDGPGSFRTGQGQAELRVYAAGGKGGAEAAWLHRGDSGRAVSVAFHRGSRFSTPLRETMDQLLDLVEFEPTA